MRNTEKSEYTTLKSSLLVIFIAAIVGIMMYHVGKDTGYNSSIINYIEQNKAAE